MKKILFAIFIVCFLASVGWAGPQVPVSPTFTTFTTYYQLSGTTGGFKTIFAEATATLSGATTTITLSIPSGAYIQGVQLRVDTAITSDNATKTWTASFSGGNSQAVCTGEVFTINTKVGSWSGGLTSNTTNILVTAAAGSFTAGVIRAIVYYNVFTAMGSL